MKLQNLSIFQIFGHSADERKALRTFLVRELRAKGVSSYTVMRSDEVGLQRFMSLLKEYDVLFVDGEVAHAFRKIHVLAPGEKEGTEECCISFHNESTKEVFLREFLASLQVLNTKVPVWGCILIGGKSSRMGQPKHLLTDAHGQTWLERTVEILSPMVDGLVISGTGDLPDSLAEMIRLPDVIGGVGPLSGILAACRWQPDVDWLLIACDMPGVSKGAVDWLLAQRKIEYWGIVPRLSEASYVEPLFALYTSRAGSIFEEQLLEERMRIGEVAKHSKISKPVIPEELQNAWSNVNTPEQLKLVNPG